MQFVIKRDVLLRSLTLVQGIIEKKNTLPILSNVLIEAKNGKLAIIATDLDLVFYDEISEIKITTEGATTTSATILYDILRKISGNSDIKFDLKSENKLNLVTDNSDFNLLCLPIDNFPNFSDDFESEDISFNSSKFLALLNKTKISISNDDTRHYLNGIYLHLTESQNRTYLTGVATDSHRLSSSSIEVDKGKNFHSIILPKKTVFQLCNLLTETNEKVLIQTSESKIQFKIGKVKLTSKVIDGKFPDYRKVIPAGNDKILTVVSSDFIQAIERVITVSSDRKEGVKLNLGKDNIKFSVNSTNSGDGNEVIKSNFTGEAMIVSFNSKYLTDIASEVEDKNLKLNLKDPVSPVLVEDMSDKNSFYVVMPMKI
jgi:DNA polymerase-3 subunit beta